MESLPEIGSKVKVLDTEIFSNGDHYIFEGCEVMIIAHDISGGIPVAVFKMDCGSYARFEALPKEFFANLPE
jgi:hypothetical protein